MSDPIVRNTSRGLEVLAVVVIATVLAMVAIPKFASASLKSKESSLKRELRSIRDSIELFKNDSGGYPLELDDLSSATPPAKYYNPTSSQIVPLPAESWKGPYISNIDMDPISNAPLKYASASGTVRSSALAPSLATDGTNYQNW